MPKKLQHINRPLTLTERRQAAMIRKGAQRDFPPKAAEQPQCPPGIPSQIHAARRQREMTRYELGRIAGVPSTVVRAIEDGDDVPLSHFRAVVGALGLKIELAEALGT
jgi:DNA-binding transcriptional regulator YiaG